MSWHHHASNTSMKCWIILPPINRPVFSVTGEVRLSKKSRWVRPTCNNVRLRTRPRIRKNNGSAKNRTSHQRKEWISSWQVSTQRPISMYSVVLLWRGQFSPNSSQYTPHSSPVRVRYGVSIVNTNSNLCSASVTWVPHAISSCIGPCYNGIPLYYTLDLDKSQPLFSEDSKQHP